jgi:excisionase family DNA binding protein
VKAADHLVYRRKARHHANMNTTATDTGETHTMPTKALYRVSEAMAILSLSRTVIYELMRSGRLRSVKEGAARLIPARAIVEYVALLEDESMRRAA